jgi:CDP-diacylglycerol--serine O-phosphatidyltransferase
MASRRLIPVLPTALTLANVVFGFLAVARLFDATLDASASHSGGVFDPAFTDRVLQACWCIVAAMVCDALDGRVARLMGADSSFGAQLDSLSDMVTFGMAPALMAKVVYTHTMEHWGLRPHPGFVTLLCSLYLMGAALRLARFNVATETEDSGHDTFLGLPSPAAAATVVSLCLFVIVGRDKIGLPQETADQLGHIMLRGLPGVAAVLGLLMVSHVRYVHVFQRYVKTRMRAPNFVLLVLVVWILWFVWEWMLFALALVYVVGGMVLWLVAKARGRSLLETLPAPESDEDEVNPESGR